MTEAEWLAATDPRPMLEFLRPKASRRKLRLFSAGCCQQIMPWNENKRVIEALTRVERYADGELADSTMEKWYQELNRINFEIRRSMGGGGSAQTVICDAVSISCLPARYSGFANAWEMLVMLGGVFGTEFHAGARALVRMLTADIFGNPFRPTTLDPSWRTEAAVGLARGMYESRDFAPLPVLADALEDAGCGDADVLAHCRGPGPHVRGCWAVDLVLGRS